MTDVIIAYILYHMLGCYNYNRQTIGINKALSVVHTNIAIQQSKGMIRLNYVFYYYKLRSRNTLTTTIAIVQQVLLYLVISVVTASTTVTL